MTQDRVRLVPLVAVALLLTACATLPRAERYGHPRYYWSYVRTPLDPFWWVELIDVKGARAKAGTGAGATVAIVGTGVLKGHEDIGMVGTGEATCGSTPADTGDSNGHGTQLAGIAVGRDPGKATRGVAPGATLVPIKVDCGVVSAAALTKGVDAAIARKPDVILLAIGGYPTGAPDVSTFMLSRVTANPSILFVIASAWDGKHYPFPPWTQAENALVVAAMTFDAFPDDRTRVNKDKEIPYGARRGHIWAPGRSIATADIEPQPGSSGHAQFLMHGTSPAAATVAGCAALVKSKTGVGGASLRGALVAGAEPKPDLDTVSNRRLNCARALP
jgi:subtilisin family serine protease